MTDALTRQLDERDVQQILRDLLVRKENYLPDWNLGDQGPGYALAQIHSRYLYAVLQRLNQLPQKLKLAFLDTIGLQLNGAQPARTVMVFQVAADSTSTITGSGTVGVRAPERTQVAGEPPPGSELTNPVVFETERSLGLTGAHIRKVISLWPGRDQYIDHTPQFAQNQPFTPFERTRLKSTPHTLYIAHEKLLALSGTVRLNLAVELRQRSSEHLQISWQYWNGESWREFDTKKRACHDESTDRDGTGGFQRSGQISLACDCAEAARKTVEGIDSYWIPRCSGRATGSAPQ